MYREWIQRAESEWPPPISMLPVTKEQLRSIVVPLEFVEWSRRAYFQSDSPADWEYPSESLSELEDDDELLEEEDSAATVSLMSASM